MLVSISVPYIRVSTAEIVTEGCEFSFYCKPYLLKLTFPHEFDEDEERNKAVYDPNEANGTLSVKLPKRVVGQHFPDLDLTTKLLSVTRARDSYKATMRGSSRSSALNGIEVLESETFDAHGSDLDESEEPAMIDSDDEESEALRIIGANNCFPYGFSSSYSNVLRNLREELSEMMEIRDPDTTTPLQRRVNRILVENALFDPERYLGDYFNGEHDPIFIEAMKYKPVWASQWDVYKDMEKLAKKQQSLAAAAIAKEDTVINAVPTVISTTDTTDTTDTHTADDVSRKTGPGPSFDRPTALEESFLRNGGFSPEEQETLASALRHREILIDRGSRRERSVLLTLIDILFAYCYDCRVWCMTSKIFLFHILLRYN